MSDLIRRKDVLKLVGEVLGDVNMDTDERIKLYAQICSLPQIGGADLIRRADAIEAVRLETGEHGRLDRGDILDIIYALPSADAVSREDYHNLLMASNDIDRALREYQAKEEFASAEADVGEYADRLWEIAYKRGKAEAEWIPCSERLPKEDGKYLVFYEGTIIGSWIEIMWYGEPEMPNVDVSGKHFYRSDSEWGDIIYDEVLAWMPLPKPYREESEA